MLSVILEVRAGTGGEDAKLFVGDMVQMYSKYCSRNSIKFELLEESSSSSIARLEGSVESLSRYEPGVHRLQRVPPTESRGRRHSSTITVAVLPESSNTEIKLEASDLKRRYYKGRGPGGQHKNKTMTGVEIVHVPSGIKASCSYGRDQKKNEALALRVLKARLKEKIDSSEHDSKNGMRSNQIGRSGRCEKIRTYNFIENRVKDERVGKAQYCLDKVMDGELDLIYRRIIRGRA